MADYFSYAQYDGIRQLHHGVLSGHRSFNCASSEVHYNTYGVAPCREFVISWYNVPMYSCNSMLSTSRLSCMKAPTSSTFIFRTNHCVRMECRCGRAGIINLSGTQSVITPGRNYPTQWSATNDGQRFMPGGAPNIPSHEWTKWTFGNHKYD